MNRPLRILLATSYIPPFHLGGDAVFVDRLARSLVQAGHEVDLLYSQDACEIAKSSFPAGSATATGARVAWLHSDRPGLACFLIHQLGDPAPAHRAKLREVFDRHYDVVHFHNVSLLGGPGVLEYSRAPVTLYTAHEYWLICPTHVLMRYGRTACTRRTCLTCTLAARRPPQRWRLGDRLQRALASVDRLFLPSRFALEKHREEGIDAPMQVLPHFVPEPVTTTPHLSHRPYFLVAGRLERLKGIQDLIPLFRELPEAELWIVGAGPYESRLRSEAQGLDNIRFLGPVPAEALGPYYAGATALLAPSLAYETFGLTVAEALAHGTPAVVRGHGALADLARDNEACLAVEDFTAQIDLLRRLLEDREWRARIGTVGRHIARQRWSEQAHLAAYHEAIGDIAPVLRGDSKQRAHGT